jgi:drug/metabolite transporter (DMT)-like permease
MKQYYHYRPVILVLLAMMFWGLTFVWVKIALEAFRPVTILMLRLIISGSLLWAFVLLFRKFQPVERSDLSLFALSALFAPFLYFLGETYGLSYVSSTLGSVIISTIPVVTPLGAWLAFRERLGWKNLAGFLFSFAGVVLMVSGEKGAGSTSIHGVLFLLFAVAAAVANTITVKKLTLKYNSFMIVTMQNTFGLLYFIPLFFLLDYPSLPEVTTDIRIWRNVIALAIFGSTFAFIFFTSAIRSLGVNKASIYSNLIPVFTALFAVIILGEQFSWMKVIGMGVVIAGVMVVSSRKKRLAP